MAGSAASNARGSMWASAIVLAACGGTSAPLPIASAAPPAPIVTAVMPVPKPAGGSRVITISRTQVFVDDAPVLALESDRAALARKGVGHERPQDPLYVMPLADALGPASVPAIDPNHPAPAEPEELLLAADATTPYRVVAQVLHTANVLGWEHVGFLVRGGSVDVDPKLAAPGPSEDRDTPMLKAIARADGLTIESRDGNIMPGCEKVGEGVAVAASRGKLDGKAVRACAERLKILYPNEYAIRVGADESVDLATVVVVVDGLATAKGRALFPRASFLPPTSER